VDPWPTAASIIGPIPHTGPPANWKLHIARPYAAIQNIVDLLAAA
jgi:hypothetical protein